MPQTPSFKFMLLGSNHTLICSSSLMFQLSFLFRFILVLFGEFWQQVQWFDNLNYLPVHWRNKNCSFNLMCFISFLKAFMRRTINACSCPCFLWNKFPFFFLCSLIFLCGWFIGILIGVGMLWCFSVRISGSYFHHA